MLFRSGQKSPKNWNFYGNRRQYVLIDEGYKLAANQLARQCLEQGDPLTLAGQLLAMRTLHMNMDNIRRSLGSTAALPDRLLLARSTSDLDMDTCLEASFGVKLSSVDRAYTLDRVYSAKLKFLQQTGHTVNVRSTLFSHEAT